MVCVVEDPSFDTVEMLQMVAVQFDLVLLVDVLLADPTVHLRVVLEQRRAQDQPSVQLHVDVLVRVLQLHPLQLLLLLPILEDDLERHAHQHEHAGQVRVKLDADLQAQWRSQVTELDLVYDQLVELHRE